MPVVSWAQHGSELRLTWAKHHCGHRELRRHLFKVACLATVPQWQASAARLSLWPTVFLVCWLSSLTGCPGSQCHLNPCIKCCSVTTSHRTVQQALEGCCVQQHCPLQNKRLLLTQHGSSSLLAVQRDLCHCYFCGSCGAWNHPASAATMPIWLTPGAELPERCWCHGAGPTALCLASCWVDEPAVVSACSILALHIKHAFSGGSADWLTQWTQPCWPTGSTQGRPGRLT